MIDAFWTATDAATAGWLYALLVQGCHDDIEGALAEQDWELMVESCTVMCRGILHCQLVLDGYLQSSAEHNVYLCLLVHSQPCWHYLRDMPIPFGTSKAAAYRARDLAFHAEAQFLERLPFDVPTIRTPTGMFTGMRVAADIEHLRHRLQLPDLDIDHLFP